MKKQLFIISSVLLASWGNIAKAQTTNIEIKEKQTPCSWGQIGWSTSFSNPNAATTDLFSKSGNSETGIPNNYMGSQDSPDGNNYVGIITYYGDFASKDKKGKWVSHGFDNWSEYAYAALPAALVAGHEYTISFKASLADNAKFATSGLGAVVTSAPIASTSSGRLTLEPQVSNSEVIKDKTGWTEIKGTFTAKGDEKYIAVGVFNKNYTVEYVGMPYQGGFQRAYYYIAAIHIDGATKKEVAPTPAPEPVVAEKKAPKAKKMDDAKKKEVTQKISYAAKSIEFETGKDVIKSTSFEKLDNVVSIMKEYDFTQWSIGGYTDNVGRPEANVALSKRRAAAVKNYFINKGIDTSRLTSEGYGAANPVESNATPQGRTANRRVEIKLNE